MFHVATARTDGMLYPSFDDVDLHSHLWQRARLRNGYVCLRQTVPAGDPVRRSQFRYPYEDASSFCGLLLTASDIVCTTRCATCNDKSCVRHNMYSTRMSLSRKYVMIQSMRVEPDCVYQFFVWSKYRGHTRYDWRGFGFDPQITSRHPPVRIQGFSTEYLCTSCQPGNEYAN